MDDMLQASRNSRNFLLTVLLLTTVLYVVVLFDFPIARQVIGFLYLTFVPGFAFLKLIKLEKTNLMVIVSFSVGFSLFILMIGGLLANEIAPAIGISKPLSDTPLIILISSITLLFSFLSHFTNKDSRVQVFARLRLITRSRWIFLLLIFPLLSVVGAIYVNVYGSSLILLFMIVALATLFAMVVLLRKSLPSELFTLIVLTIAITLLFHSSLISNYVQPRRSDISLEYFITKNTEENSRWSSVLANYSDLSYGRYNSMLSITILPTIFSSLLNLDLAWTFKILYPIFFSLVAVVLFYFWRPHVGKKGAFIAVFFLMAQETFYTEALSLARQMIAELFFVLLLVVILDKKIKSAPRWVSFAIFSIGLVISHYGLAIIFFFFIFAVWMFLTVTRRRTRKITLLMIIFFFVAMFSWYIFTSNSSTFDSILWFGNNVYGELGQFLNPASRGTAILSGLGLEAAPSFLNAISRVIAYFIQFLIVVGFIVMLRKKVRAKIDRVFLTFTQVAMVLLLMLILVPGLAETLNMTRFFHILLFFLAPVCLFGAGALVKFIFRREAKLKVMILLLAVLVPYFLFQTSFVYEVTGSDSWLTVPLSKYRMGGLRLYGQSQYVGELDVFGAQWFHKNVEVGQNQIYSDFVSRYVTLTTYGLTYRPYVEMITNTTRIAASGTVYLNQLNVVDGVIVHPTQWWNYSDIPFLGNLNKIYSNGGSEIYKG
ncbi:MAG: DUF2206 domain-containing protein [Candidatus Hodarchaeales archaeon]|jgi:uncharacterized membrane protein